METVYIKDEIARCEDADELKQRIFPLITSQQEQWKGKIAEIITASGMTKSKFAELCGVSRVSLDKWCKGSIPKNRETFLRIGLLAGYDLDEMNQLLQRYGRYPALYSKSLEDCVCIFVVEHDFGELAIEKYELILNKIKSNIVKTESLDDDMNTVLFDKKLSQVKNEDELERFVAENSHIFATAYHRFYAFVKMNIMANYTDSVFEIAEGQGWSSSLRHCVSAIRQNKWYPTRNKIISLGLHLSMDHEQIDEMLELAHMEPLCAKNVFESVIMFIVDDASLNDILNEELDTYDPDELCRYAKSVLSEFDLPEIESFISEIAEMD